MATLVLVHPADLKVVVGRSESCSIRICRDDVSRRHARIYRTADAWFVEDLRSTNGCYVNDVPVDTCVLRDADFIKIGGVIFKFQIAGDVEVPPPDGGADSGGSGSSPVSPATAADFERFRN